MIPYSHRFHGYNALRFVYKNGSSVRSHLVTIKYTTNPRRKNSRFAVVVSKKVLKGAVGRNRIRRRLYEVIRTELPQLRQNIDVAVIVTSRDTGTIPAESLTGEITTLIRQAGLYKNHSETDIIPS